MFKTFMLICVLFFNMFCLAEDELLSVIVVFRHGARTPVEPYPNDPYKNASYWPVGFGQLTDEGKRQHYDLGRWFRNRYNGFVPDKNFEKYIYVLSTDVDRTLMSAEANLAGFFPPEQEFHQNLLWQPIPIHTRQEKNDEILAMKKECPKYNKLLEDLYRTAFLKNITHQYHDLYAYLARYSGSSVGNPDDVEYIYNTFTIERSFNYTLPPWALKVFPDKMKYLASLSFALYTYTPELIRLKTGPFFNLITEHFINISSYSTGHHKHSKDNVWDRKLLIFSAHDTTIASILNSMGLFDLHCPPFASTILFELRKRQDNTTYLNLFYKNSSNPIQLCLKGCDLDCNLDKFIEILKPIIISPREWEEECTVNWFDFLPFGYKGNVMVITTLLSLTLFSLSFFLALTCFKSKKQSRALYQQLSSEET
ncbi:hypothetical protein WA026_016764 [Henosepilachna vigintioctopunctata]|uniref:acid phosphatase n=1 Tax=Henosepilachna vigintioctopunctata TaxID=420089 RepID=A0AAW1USG3_9CUCU